jgi:hypothetical protein
MGLSGISKVEHSMSDEITERDKELELYRRLWMEKNDQVEGLENLNAVRMSRIVELELRVLELEAQIFGSK